MEQTHVLPHPFDTQAAEKWRAFTDALGAAGQTLPEQTNAVDLIQRAFVFSDFIHQSWMRQPRMASELLRSGDLERRYHSDEYPRQVQKLLEHVETEEALVTKLRHYRCREMTRIAFRDLTGSAGLDEITGDLSALADAAIQGALSCLHRWHCTRFGIPMSPGGQPLQLVVMGMGKLGARELNFSSDIDLVFAYPESGNTLGRETSVTNEQFFTRLSRRLIHVLGSKTADGIVFRVDMNLRPFGESGPLVMTFEAMESYYQEQGREWERYAWIKARGVAGDSEAATRLLNLLNPFIYRRYLDYGVFESLREMKRNIAQEVKRKGMEDNIKLGAGGIREVEFFGQIFQLLRGGVVPGLQERRIQTVLMLLVREGIITDDICRELGNAYRFLRNTEHRIQAFSDSQTHLLPSKETDRQRLALSMGFDRWEEFRSRLTAHMKRVHYHFNSLLDMEEDVQEDRSLYERLGTVWQQSSNDEASGLEVLAQCGYPEPEEALKQLDEFRDHLGLDTLSSEGRKRIDRLIPMVLALAGASERPMVALSRIMALIQAVRRRTSYVALLLENPGALNHLVKLADTSGWILSFLTRHPVLLDELLDSRTLFSPPERAELEKELARRLERIDPSDLEIQMDDLRIFRQIHVLKVAAADITDAIPLMRVSDYLSDIAETVLNRVLDLAASYLADKYGFPSCTPCLAESEKGFVIIAYGKLGGLELGYNSDLDLVFLHSGAKGTTNGALPIDATTYFARLGQRILHMLSTHTTNGRLYEADMRLRPSGSSGILVSSLEGFRTYQTTEAWIWEKQALIRARPVAGDQRLMAAFEEIRKEILAQPREKAPLRKEIIEMRRRMKAELLKSDPGFFDLKQGDGGMVDIEFLVQYLVLQHAYTHPEILKWTDNVRLIGALKNAGVVDESTAYFMRKAYLVYRSVGHKLNLKEQPSVVPENQFADLQKQVTAIWRQIMEK